MYPGQLSLPDIYLKSFLDGGPTMSQLMFLFESGSKRKYRDYQGLAALQGIEMDDPFESDGGGKKSSGKTLVRPSGGFKFGDPAAYADMSEEERKKLTKKMMGKHKVWNKTGFVDE